MLKKSNDGKTRVLSLSYGKDSMACLGALELLDMPLDRIVTVDVWATDEIQADLPPMIEFKDKADRIIKSRYGIEVEHFHASKVWTVAKEKVTYQDYFYHKITKGKFAGTIQGFSTIQARWCLELKLNAIKNALSINDNPIQYVGIAEDEVKRLTRLDGVTKISPLHLIGWTEEDAKKWCIENDLLSPLYTDTVNRGGVGFVIYKHFHN